MEYVLHISSKIKTKQKQNTKPNVLKKDLLFISNLFTSCDVLGFKL